MHELLRNVTYPHVQTKFQFIHLQIFFKHNYVKLHDRINSSDLPEVGSVTGYKFPFSI
jgi:hypothetical protein